MKPDQLDAKIEQLRLERDRWTIQRRQALTARAELRKAEKNFEDRMRKFRAVQAASWDAVISHSRGSGDVKEKLNVLRRLLDATDHLWKGFAGCAGDPRSRPEGQNSLVM